MMDTDNHEIIAHTTRVVAARERLRAILHDGPIHPTSDVLDAARCFVEACEAIPTHLRAATIGEPTRKEHA